jgi:heme a synthase
VIAAVAWRRRAEEGAAPGVSAALIGIVVFQGLLGMWTVTLLLKPAIVTAHLIGGMTTLGILAWLCVHAYRLPTVQVGDGLRRLARLSFALLAAQIVLGGWVSTNYAALACTDFPTCHGSLWPSADYSNAFHVVRELGMTARGELLSHEALTAIHWMHRIGALVAGLALIGLGLVLRRNATLRRTGDLLLAAVVLQIALGIANVLLSLPLLLAAAHNAGAALLVVIMVCINYRVTKSAAIQHQGGRDDERARHENSFA